MTNQILTHPAPSEQAAPVRSAPVRPNPLSGRQALALGRLALAYLLLGEPEPCTFDIADLENALTRLGELQAALEVQGDL